VGLVGFVAFAGCQVLFGVDLPEQDAGGAGSAAGVGFPGGGTGGNPRKGAGGIGGAETGGMGGNAGGVGVSGGGQGGTPGGGAGGLGGEAGWPSPGPIVINELFFDAPTTDVGCFIELKGPPNASLAGYKLRGINGQQTTPQDFYAEIVFDASRALDANGYFVVAQDATVNVASNAAFVINVRADLQNGPDNVLLLGPGDIVVDGVGYSGFDGTFEPPDVFRGEIAAAVSPPDANKGFSLSRLPDGTDAGNNATDFGLGTKTPGAPNAGAPAP
jgi:hypothetical protein